jgi:hypothetical protein
MSHTKLCHWIGPEYNRDCHRMTSDYFCFRHTFCSLNNINVLREKKNTNSKTVFFYDKFNNTHSKYFYYHGSWLNVSKPETINTLNYAYHEYNKSKWLLMYLVFKTHMTEAFDIWHNMIYFYMHR